jgi:hypothetical protein
VTAWDISSNSATYKRLGAIIIIMLSRDAKFARDSPLEGTGFELSVPLARRLSMNGRSAAARDRRSRRMAAAAAAIARSRSLLPPAGMPGREQRAEQEPAVTNTRVSERLEAVTFQMAEVAVSRQMFQEILSLISRPLAARAPA